jgi:5'-nucleotidase
VALGEVVTEYVGLSPAFKVSTMRNSFATDRFWTWVLATAAGAVIAPTGCGGDSAATPQKLVILHTNDLHSHFLGVAPEGDYSPASPGDDATRGGMARLASAIGAARADATAAGTPLLLLDGGDFMMGTLFELLATRAASELALMQALGYDATTIGNHELDWTPAGLAAILAAAAAKNVQLPILGSNMRFDPQADGDDDLEAAAAAGAIRTKLVKTVGTLRVGFFGLLGQDAADVTPQKAPLTFAPIATAATQMISELRQVDKVDLVIALSHSGIDGTGHGEDEALAASVPGIDVIISGHTHDTLTAPAQVGRTLIVTAGSYGKYLGKLELSVTLGANPGDSPTVVVDHYRLLDIDDQIPGDPTTQDAVDAYIAGVDQALAPAGLTYKQVVGETGADLTLPAHAEAPVGNLISDAYRTVTAALQPGAPPVVAVEASGQIRASIAKGKTGQIWLADLFRVVPDGIGPDQNPGYPLVTFYLNAKDLRSGLELDAAQDVVADQFFLQVSGLEVAYDMSRSPFGRVTSLQLVTALGPQPLDPTNTTTCYKVVATSYVAGLLGVVKSTTAGALEVVAKDADCTTPVDPTTRFVDADPASPGVTELKGWQALLQYVSGLPDSDGNGIPNVPAAYATPQGRIVAR